MDYWLLTEEEESLVLAEELKDRVVGIGNEQGNKEKKDERDEEMLMFFCLCWCCMMKIYFDNGSFHFIDSWTLVHSHHADEGHGWSESPVLFRDILSLIPKVWRLTSTPSWKKQAGQGVTVGLWCRKVGFCQPSGWSDGVRVMTIKAMPIGWRIPIWQSN
jgi:hypothetical protein